MISIPAKQIVFWRHGQTAQNLAARIQGTTDNPLNETGLAQAKKIAPELVKLGITKVVCSDLLRARQTAQAFVDLTNLPITFDARLRERAYGLWEGKTAAEIKAQWPVEYEMWRAGKTPTELGVETRKSVADRAGVCIAQVLAESDAADVVLFVAHGGTISNVVIGLLGMDPDQWVGLHGLDNCHWAVLEPREKQHPKWRIRSYNRTTADVDQLTNAWR